jgi:hypothetical protein
MRRSLSLNAGVLRLACGIPMVVRVCRHDPHKQAARLVRTRVGVLPHVPCGPTLFPHTGESTDSWPLQGSTDVRNEPPVPTSHM